MFPVQKIILPILLSLVWIQSASAQFDSIDQKARDLKNRGLNTEKLASEIEKQASLPLDKIRFLYVFITSNIRYDVDAFLNGKESATKPDDVLKSGKAVCQGYANLFHEVCRLLGIRSQVVSGFSKGYGFNGKMDSKSNHAWIAIYINDQWHLLDPTWGAGYLNQKQKFIAHFQPKYFLTNPAELVTKHLPEDPAFQLLECPIDVKNFLKDSLSVLALARNCQKGEFKFADTLQSEFGLSDSLRILRQASRMASFADFGTYSASIMVLNLAHKHGGGLNEKSTPLETKLLVAKRLAELYKIALNYARKSKAPEAKQLRELIENNIKNVDLFVRQIEEIMRQ